MSRNAKRVLAAVTAAALAAVMIPTDAQATRQHLTWQACPADTPVPAGALPLADYQCADLTVPMSYPDPDGAQIQMAVGRLPAADQAHKIGTIFYNPGGPGNPGRIPPVLTAALHQRFDLVGFDPRGVGASTPLHCFASPDQLAVLQRVAGQFPTTPDQAQRQIADALTIDQWCGQNAGPLINHMSTANVARDLDRLRAAVGESTLSYYGLSYGTVLGETYANLFPDRVRAVVLDAVDDPVNWFTGYHPADANVPFSVRLAADLGTEQALHSFLTACAADARCAFREPGGDLSAKFDRVLDRLAAGPVTITDPDNGQPVTIRYQDAIVRTIEYLTDADNSPVLARFLQALGTSDAVAVQAESTPITTPADNLLAGGATQCADATNPSDPSVWPRYAAATDLRARGFGPFFTYLSLPCVRFPSEDADRYAGPWDRHTAHTVLLVGNRQGDPETPYDGAQRTARDLGNARLLTLDSFGHGSLGHSQCIDDAVNAYFFRVHLPAVGTVCAPDHSPFG
ncbi:alpha/beta fold hydrolase [Kutzneria buriramensis]|uniref:TAP-like protein n=1 Tax=Kutzneria buriramensis TaxID=1045776 RepID=A0A3E0HG64_9PSEU|nr:alpha/beta fold hydrolase [Kutzneria buriramensis]REH44708.1 TAP-like protein [Kutzneria buriramensis]